MANVRPGDRGPPNRILDVTELADRMRAEVRRYTASLRRRPGDAVVVRLAGILAVDDATPDDGLDSKQVYAAQIQETLREDGIAYEHVECRGEDPMEEILTAIEERNARPDVDGILVYHPIFKKHPQQDHQHRGPYMNASTGVYYKTWDDRLQDVVCPTKDVEGLSHYYRSQWQFRSSRPFGNGELYVPCTALAVLRILEFYHSFSANRWRDVTATIVNRSKILGWPLAALLSSKGATVFSVDQHSIVLFQKDGKRRRCPPQDATLEGCLSRSSIVVTGVPHPDFSLPLECIASENTNLINVSEFPNVAKDNVPCRFVPHIGKVTVAALEQNLIQKKRQQIQSFWQWQT